MYSFACVQCTFLPTRHTKQISSLIVHINHCSSLPWTLRWDCSPTPSQRTITFIAILLFDSRYSSCKIDVKSSSFLQLSIDVVNWSVHHALADIACMHWRRRRLRPVLGLEVWTYFFIYLAAGSCPMTPITSRPVSADSLWARGKSSEAMNAVVKKMKTAVKDSEALSYAQTPKAPTLFPSNSVFSVDGTKNWWRDLALGVIFFSLHWTAWWSFLEYLITGAMVLYHFSISSAFVFTWRFGPAFPSSAPCHRLERNVTGHGLSDGFCFSNQTDGFYISRMTWSKAGAGL